jgi:hypothetical protein
MIEAEDRTYSCGIKIAGTIVNVMNHDINSKTTFTLITLFFTLVMFLSFCHSKIVICGIITGRQHIKAMI